MVLTLAIVLALVLPWPANAVVIVLGVVGEIGEIVWGRRLARRWRPKTGPEAMIGQTATVVEACRPTGTVRVHGELWEARCQGGADADTTVRIASLDGLMLTVVGLDAHPPE
jgi:membrane-bound serine protease (ClpP class)